MTGKSISYEEATATAETLILNYRKQAQECDGRLKQQYESWAFGVYILWHSLYSGYMNEEDHARLEALTK